MPKFNIPDPILDDLERKRFKTLTEEYQKFRSPGRIAKAIAQARDAIVKFTPKKFKQLTSDAFSAASEHAVIKQAMENAGKGFSVMGSQTAKWLVITPEQVLNDHARAGHEIGSYEYICTLRSYWIDKVARSRDYQHHLLAGVEGAATGAPGLIGIPFNIAFSFLLFFRATQSVAMHYGYDVKNNAAELETAAQVTLECLAPGTAEGDDSFAGLIGKMMLIGELSALNASLSKTYGQMIAKGGASRFYVQFRALANKAAEKALKRAGEKGMEAGIFKNFLEQAAKQLPKFTAQKAIPLISAFIGAGVDTYVMHRVLIGANLIYHKRFLLEKEDSIRLLNQSTYK